MATKSVQRSLALIREQGGLPWVVEHWNQFARKRQDLFNIIDILVIVDKSILGVQCCGMDFSSHDQKILESEYSLPWLEAGGRLELWGWRKLKKVRGKKATEWKMRLKVYSKEDFNGKKKTEEKAPSRP